MLVKVNIQITSRCSPWPQLAPAPYHLCLRYSQRLKPILQGRSLPYFRLANGFPSITFTLAFTSLPHLIPDHSHLCQKHTGDPGLRLPQIFTKPLPCCYSNLLVKVISSERLTSVDHPVLPCQNILF